MDTKAIGHYYERKITEIPS